MIALLLAAATTFLPHDQILPHQLGLSVAPETVCKGQGAVQTSFAADPVLLLRPQDRSAIRPLKLGDLPKANHEIAVARTIGGCAAPVVVSYKVEGDGRFAGDDK
jgi:hypothetical protein